MNEEVQATLEFDNQILAATAHTRDALSSERGGDRLRGLWSREPGIEDLDCVEAPSREDGRETRPNRLDLRQLGHDDSASADNAEDDRSRLRRLRRDGVAGGDLLDSVSR
jgi:hypothetical protein